jgi:hypothetical protein
MHIFVVVLISAGQPKANFCTLLQILVMLYVRGRRINSVTIFNSYSKL